MTQREYEERRLKMYQFWDKHGIMSYAQYQRCLDKDNTLLDMAMPTYYNYRKEYVSGARHNPAMPNATPTASATPTITPDMTETIRAMADGLKPLADGVALTVAMMQSLSGLIKLAGAIEAVGGFERARVYIDVLERFAVENVMKNDSPPSP